MSRISPFTHSTFSAHSNRGMKERYNARIFFSCPANAFTRCEPTRPLAPVTKILFSELFCTQSFKFNNYKNLFLFFCLTHLCQPFLFEAAMVLAVQVCP